MAPHEKPTMAVEGLVREHKLAPDGMTERLTPADDLFVLAHLGIPEVRAESWRLTVDGLVDAPLELSLDDLLQRPAKIVETVHQCAGSPMNPTVPTRRIANVQWTGVDLRDLLTEAGIRDGATHVWAAGLDHGEFAGEVLDNYVKDVPLVRVEAGDVLVAWELNGEPLPLKHGFPVRLVVPGFFGTNSVKWLDRLHIADARAGGLFTTRFYNDPVPNSDATRPVWEIAPESLIVTPAADATLPTGPVEIWGWAWSAVAVETLEVSTDGGSTWTAAHLEARQNRAWQRFSHEWHAPAPGSHTLMCRATDANGEQQPLDGARNAVFSVAVTISD